MIHDPLDAVVDFGTGDVSEEFTQERVGFRDQFGGFLPAEVLQSGIVKPCREHAVRDGLRVHVGEAFRSDVMDQDLLKGVHLVFQRAVFLIRFVARERFFDHVRKQARFAGHHLR